MFLSAYFRVSDFELLMFSKRAIEKIRDRDQQLETYNVTGTSSLSVERVRFC